MRTEAEMMELILDTARADGRIRAAYMGGSRVNPHAPRDIFQDYDVVYVVDSTLPFRQDARWIDRFGERLYMQYPEDGPYYESDVENCYGWLMQFADGNRMDLHVCTAPAALSDIAADPMVRVLLDKDGLLNGVGAPSDRAHWVKPFTQEQLAATCNEFWWCLNNVAKGLWRGELSYALEMLDMHVRPMLRRVLEWRAGQATGFTVSVGKSCKYIERYLEPGIWQEYLATYAPAQPQAVWDAVMRMCALMDAQARIVAAEAGYEYDAAEAASARGYLEHVRALPRDAQGVY